MVEYLDPRDGYSLVTLPDWKAPEPWLIEVPEGAEEFTAGGCFYKDNRKHYWDSVRKRWGKVWATVRTNSVWQRPTLPEELPFIDDEPPAYFGNAIRLKPRIRMYAKLVYNVDIQIVIPLKPQRITITGTTDDCVRVPKLTADYLFNTVQTLGFVSDEQKGAVLYHLNYLKVN